MVVLRHSSIAAYVTDHVTGERRDILTPHQEFRIHEPGVYSIEGDNQAGKSVLIRFLMGALPPLVEKASVECATELGSQLVQIRTIADALRNGLVAVFQDDRLIPSMTIREQLLVRHGTSKWRHAVGKLWHRMYDSSAIKTIADALFPEEWVRHMSLSENQIYADKEIEERAKRLLESYGTSSNTRHFVDILDKYPRQLSGGATAVARLVLAQLHDPIRVLFLDEALTGVQADLWPHLVRSLLRWRKEKKTSIVVVTHNQEEMALWQPRESFVVANGGIDRTTVKGYARRHRCIPPVRTGFIHVFEPPYRDAWLNPFTGPFVTFIDTSVIAEQPTKDVLEFLRQHGDVHEVSVEISEKAKAMDMYQSLVVRCLDVLPRPSGVIVCIGGGVLLNLAGFVAATVHRGLVPAVLVPTTAMSVADVAIGSKTALNFMRQDGHFMKHAVGVYFNPAAVVFDRRFLSSLSAEALRKGMAECLKHALLHGDEPLLQSTLSVIQQNLPSANECYRIAMDVSSIKANLLTQDPYEQHVARSLLYGHLHAHSLERATGFSVSHGTAVYWGILIDLKLAGVTELYSRVLKALRAGNVLPSRAQVEAISAEDLRKAYLADTHWDATAYEVIRVGEVGPYHPLKGSALQLVEVNWAQIKTAHDDVLRDAWVSDKAEKLPARNKRRR